MKLKNKADIWMAIYPGDHLAATLRLSTLQHGILLLLLLDYWVNGPLPDVDATLANIAKLTEGEWLQHRNALSMHFDTESGVWRHLRTDLEKAKAVENVRKLSIRGTAGANAKWGKKDSSMPDANETDAKSMQQACENSALSTSEEVPENAPSPSPSPSPPSSTSASPPTSPAPSYSALPSATTGLKAEQLDLPADLIDTREVAFADLGLSVLPSSWHVELERQHPGMTLERATLEFASFANFWGSDRQRGRKYTAADWGRKFIGRVADKLVTQPLIPLTHEVPEKKIQHPEMSVPSRTKWAVPSNGVHTIELMQKLISPNFNAAFVSENLIEGYDFLTTLSRMHQLALKDSDAFREKYGFKDNDYSH